MKKWFPFILLIIAISILSFFLILSKNTDDYVPTSANSAQIYHEACARCHGEDGRGTRILYPGLLEDSFSDEEVIRIVKKGRLLMPSFPQIPDSTLKNLANYVTGKKMGIIR